MYIIGIDQGTSGSRALILDEAGEMRGYGYEPLARIYPDVGWVEQDPNAVSHGVRAAIVAALSQAGIAITEIAACGIACQRNTEFVWDARTRQPVANAITWQDLRTIPMLNELATWPALAESRYRLGYAPGPYSAALHLGWRMQHDSAVIEAAQAGTLRLGLSAAWLLNDLGTPTAHQMDYSLVQATGLYDFRAQDYWHDWLDHLHIPTTALPETAPTLHDFGTLRLNDGNGATADIPVLTTIGNEQAALFGHGCRLPGEAECTHGTASFVSVFHGEAVPEQDKLNTYFAWHLGEQPTYCIEADTAVTGAAIRWMKEQARLIDRDDEIGPLAASVPNSGGVVFVPAFTGLNVPYNDLSARGTIIGLTLDSSRAHIVRAFLEALGYQVRAILETIKAETGLHVKQLNLGGGVSASDEACQIQADLLGIPTIRPAFPETSARAAALFAGLKAGFWPNVDSLPPSPGTPTIFEPRLSTEQRDEGYARWQKAVARARGWSEG